jgi:hypothetical protein
MRKIHNRGNMEAPLMVKLWEIASGVTWWTKSIQGKDPMARLAVDTNGNFNFGTSNPYGFGGELLS